ncbi:MAG: hypothetical protein IJH31_05105 [Erysipelotrichaceae bacterium]|nr:hypothetical protein [Erysipelotrichaceae bacterium]
MAGKYKPGDTVYIVSSVKWIKEAKVLKYSGGFYTLQFTDTVGGIKLRESRRFPTEEEAKKGVGERKTCKRTPM